MPPVGWSVEGEGWGVGVCEVGVCVLCVCVKWKGVLGRW